MRTTPYAIPAELSSTPANPYHSPPAVELHEIENAMANMYTDAAALKKGQNPKGKIQLTSALASFINKNMAEGKPHAEGITFA
eukprot:1638483-Pyramimonas_sp.AAC.1